MDYCFFSGNFFFIFFDIRIFILFYFEYDNPYYEKSVMKFEKMSLCKPFQYISRGEEKLVEVKHNAN